MSALKKMYEKYFEKQKDLYMVFMDLEREYAKVIVHCSEGGVMNI